MQGALQASAKPFWYWDKENMAIVGRTFALADLKHMRFSGLTAWLLRAGIHIYLIGFANRLLVTLQGQYHLSRNDAEFGFFHSHRRK